MSQREQALEFVRRFAAGDVDGLEPLLSENLQLAGPYLQVVLSPILHLQVRGPSYLSNLSTPNGGQHILTIG